jgi:hypothetical protein
MSKDVSLFYTNAMQKLLPIEETAFILSRASSGIMNGSFYGLEKWLAPVGLVLTLTFTFISLRRSRKQRKLSKRDNWIWWITLIGSLLSTLCVFLAFLFPPLMFDIHLFTLLAQSFQTFGMFLNNPKKWWRLLLLVAPAVFFQKLFINLLGGNLWNYQGTNVASGAYYSVLGFKIPRLFSGNMVARLALTIFNLFILIGTYKERKQ